MAATGAFIRGVRAAITSCRGDGVKEAALFQAAERFAHDVIAVVRPSIASRILNTTDAAFRSGVVSAIEGHLAGARRAGDVEKLVLVYIGAEDARVNLGEDEVDLDDVMDAGLTAVRAVADSPRVAIQWAADTATSAVSGAGQVLRTAAGEVSGAAGALIPWGVIVGAVAVVGALVGLTVWASKAGALKDVKGIVR